jgi:hypothetical protein
MKIEECYKNLGIKHDPKTSYDFEINTSITYPYFHIQIYLVGLMGRVCIPL